MKTEYKLSIRHSIIGQELISIGDNYHVLDVLIGRFAACVTKIMDNGDFDWDKGITFQIENEG